MKNEGRKEDRMRKLLLILTNFLKSSHFLYLEIIKLLLTNFTVFVVEHWMFRFPGGLLTNSSFFSSIHLSLLNMILFKASASHRVE